MVVSLDTGQQTTISMGFGPRLRMGEFCYDEIGKLAPGPVLSSTCEWDFGLNKPDRGLDSGVLGLGDRFAQFFVADRIKNRDRFRAGQGDVDT